MPRLDQQLRILRPDLSWTRIRQAIEGGQVTLDSRIERDPAAQVTDLSDVSLDVSRPRARAARIPLRRLYEDTDVLVIDKPAGLLTIATHPSQRNIEDSVLRRAQDYARHLHGRSSYAGVLHRLDRDTSGALALALSRPAHARGRELFSRHGFERHYLALVHGVPAPGHGTIDLPVSRSYQDGRRRVAWDDDVGLRAITHFQVREALHNAALVELHLDTGRQHQIRLHMQHIGHPLLGEAVYLNTEAHMRAHAPRQMLHAWRLAFPHPVDGTPIAVEAPPPDDFSRTLERLRVKKGKGRR